MLRAFFLKFLSILLLAGWACASVSAAEVPKPETVLSTLDKQHPRLLLKDKNLEEIKALMQKDELLKKCVKDVVGRADKAMRKPPLKYEKIGPRLLQVSRDCLDRVYALALAWRNDGATGTHVFFSFLLESNFFRKGVSRV
ncbi:MAG: hypothetical protein NTX50_11725 [Candidatus Sumerlaeota bacterium]|nr:hypothetical protein [Candidatus Sumerlaeota bacterium]